MNQNQLKSLHYFNLATLTSSSGISRYYGTKLECFNEEKSIKYPESVTPMFCGRCGQVHIPGFNVKIRCKHQLVYKCLSCKHTNKYNLSATTSDKSKDTAKTSKALSNLEDTAESTSGTKKPNRIETSGNKVEKSEKSGKRKRHKTLQSLLDQKKRSSSPSLDLMEFMN